MPDTARAGRQVQTASMLPAPGSKGEALAFIERILSDQGLQHLVEATSCRSGGLRRMHEHLAALGPGLPSPERVQAQRILNQWAATLRAGDPAPPGAPPAERITWLRSVARGRWDVRCGRERDRIPVSCDVLPPDLADLVRDLADRWGMAGPMAAHGAFDAAVILGGQLISNRNRSAFAAQLLRTGSVRYPLAVGLACRRRLSRSEQSAAPSLLATEADAMEYGMEQAFGVSADDWCTMEPGLRGQRRSDGLQLLATHIPLEGTRRPDTGGSFDWLIATGALRHADRLLCVTTPIFWIQNHSNLLIRLPGPHPQLITAGGTADVAGAPVFRSQHYLQEIKAAVDVLTGLLAWAQPR